MGLWIVIVNLSNNEYFARHIERYKELSSDNNEGTSGEDRIYKGFSALRTMDAVHLMIGVGAGNQYAYARNNSTLRAELNLYDKDDHFYMNSIQEIIIGGGFVSLFLFMLFCINSARSGLVYNKFIFLLLFVTSFETQTLWNSYMLYMFFLSWDNKR